MKKFLAIIAVAAFVACNNSGETKDAAAADSARKADSTKTADSLKAVQQMQQQDTMHKMDTSAMKAAPKDTAAAKPANKMQKK